MLPVGTRIRLISQPGLPVPVFLGARGIIKTAHPACNSVTYNIVWDDGGQTVALVPPDVLETIESG
jgi:hypothetical protein